MISIFKEIFKALKEVYIEATNKHSVCALVTNGDLILSVSRKGDYENIGLPGGKREFGETEVQAVLRELKEETGALPQTGAKVRKIFSRKKTATYEVQIGTAPELGVNHENAMVRWSAIEDFLKDNCKYRDYNGRLFRKIYEK